MRMRESTRRRIALGVSGFLLLCFSGFGIVKIYYVSPLRWANIFESKEGATDKDQVLAALARVTRPDGKVDEHALLKLARFKTVQGREVDLQIVQARFLDDQISPKDDLWQNLGERMVLVNSVDQNQSVDLKKVSERAIARHINPGCGFIEQSKIEPPKWLNPGEADLHPCLKPYSDEGIKWLDNLAIVTYDAQGTQKPCFNRYASTDNDKYQDCVVKDLKVGLEYVFNQLRTLKPTPTAVIFPAIATGQGKLLKGTFYEEFAKQLLRGLENSEKDNSFLPRNIYLRVDADNSPEEWYDTRFSLSEQIPFLVSSWNHEPHGSAEEWSSVIGVTLAFGMVLVVIAGRYPTSMLGVSLHEFYTGTLWLRLVGWFLASLGLMKSFDFFVPLLPDPLRLWGRVALGILLVLGIVPLSLALDSGKQLSQSTHLGRLES